VALINFNGSPHGGTQRHLPEWQSQPRITPTTIIDHSIVGSGESAWQMFATRSGLESHFIVLGRRSGTKDGHIWQLMDTGRQADANLNGNGYALSIETEDDGDPDNQPWTGAQLRSLIWLHAELRRVHPTIPNRRSRSCSDPGGHGYHTIHGAPSCWTPVAKSCPGRVRVVQWRADLLPAYLTGQEADMPLDQGDRDDIRKIVAQELDKFRSERPANLSADPNNKPLTMGELQGAYPNAGVPGVRKVVDATQVSVNTVEASVQPTANALGQLQAQVAELTKLVKGLALGSVEGGDST
jgi:N-acetylmuramoyl-L-alanine amidase